MGEQFDASRPIYAQLVERLKARVLAGTYPPGGHLDSVRDLAAAAGVNPNTMQRALAPVSYTHLIALYIEKRIQYAYPAAARQEQTALRKGEKNFLSAVSYTHLRRPYYL